MDNTSTIYRFLINEKSKQVKICASPEHLEAMNVLPPYNDQVAFKKAVVVKFNVHPTAEIVNNCSKVRLAHDKKNVWTIFNKYLEHIK